MKIDCEECGRKIRNSFMDKLNHMVQYHPDRILNRWKDAPQVGYSIGYRLGQMVKGLTDAKKEN